MSDGFFVQLRRAHAHIEERLSELESAADALTESDDPKSGVARIAVVLAFFDDFGVRHHEDEEESLFPRLRDLPAFQEMMKAFEFQHRMAVREESEFAAHVRRYAPGAEAALRAQAQRFVEVQRSHMLAEEKALFPLAERTLGARELQQMASEVRARTER